jgi:hypothetical protein
VEVGIGKMFWTEKGLNALLAEKDEEQNVEEELF